MKKPLMMTLFICLFCLSGCIGSGKISEVQRSQKGHNMFPEMTGIDLLGEERSIPDTFTGKYNLVNLAFEQEQQELVNEWIEVAEEIMQEHDDLRYYEIPVIYEVSAAYRMFINNGMRGGIPSPQARERTITVYTDREKLFTMMDMKQSSIYTFLLDDQGKILWRGEGVPDANQLASIKQILSQ